MVASDAHPHNLPLQPTSFIGRDQELMELAAALNKTRLLTLTGCRWSWQDRLALALAERVAEAYADGTWFIELAPLADAALVRPDRGSESSRYRSRPAPIHSPRWSLTSVRARHS